MPGYRDDYPRRRPPRMPERGGRDPYGRPPRRPYPPDRRPPRPRDGYPGEYGRPRRPQPGPGYYNDGYGGYDGRYDDPYGMDYGAPGYDDGYIGRRASRPVQSDYYGNPGDERFAMAADEFSMNDFFAAVENDAPSDAASVPSLAEDEPVFEDDMDSLSDDFDDMGGFDDFDDFDDLSDTDDFDEWLSGHESLKSAPARREPAPRHAPDRWDGMGGDGFEDDDDMRRPARRNPHGRNAGPFEEDDFSSDMGGFGGAAGQHKGGFGKNRPMIVFVSGLLLIAVLVGVALIMSSGGSGKSTMMLDSTADTVTVEQAETMITGLLDELLSNVQCSVTVDGQTATLKLSDCEVTYVGRHNDGKSRYVTGTDPVTGEVERTEYAIYGVLSYNKTALSEFFNTMRPADTTPVSDPYFIVDYDNSVMTVRAGTDGWGVDAETFLSQLSSGIVASGGGSLRIVCSGGHMPARALTAQDIYNQAVTEPVDAFTSTDSSGQTVYHSEINGVDFSREELETLIAGGGSEWQLPVKVTRPAVNLKDIKKYTFPDVLASYYTYYGVSNVGRSHNLSLAAELINSMILEPGEQFSFNDRVGQRTPERGFKLAGVYAGEGNSEDYGGGICQTSSTLYYTCILANLQIDERTNHLYTVGYMQTAKGRNTVFGNDATVNWGWSDYKFTNNKEYPIRIDFWAKDGILTCEIRGTADGYTADFAYETVRSMPFKVKYLRDNGTKDQAGQNGYVVNVYRIVYKDGVEVDRNLESRNTYTPMNKVIYTNELPAGYEYGVEYDQDYDPATATTTTTEPSTETTTTQPPDDGAVG